MLFHTSLNMFDERNHYATCESEISDLSRSMQLNKRDTVRTMFIMRSQRTCKID